MAAMKNHDAELDHPNSTIYSWIPDFVYGGIDGAITTFAVVAGVEGAALSVPIILILGFANLFADGFSMSVGKYLSDKSQLEQYAKIREVEFEHIKTRTAHEKQEVREIMETYNFKGHDLERATDIITSSPEAWVDLMMRNEFSMTHENVSPIRGGVVTFISFVTVGFIPLLGYLFNIGNQFLTACIATGLALFLVGTIKSRFSMRHWFISGLETSLIGGLAATIAYFVGYFLQGIVS